ncbi:MAG: hypothetical protein PVF50_01695 [Gammaproteobacteria bacterium]
MIQTVLRGACLIFCVCVVPAGDTFAQSNSERPDFSGVWFPQGFARRTPNPLPFTEPAAALVESFSAEFTSDDDPGRYCIWPGLPRVIWGAPFAVEIFHRPQDLTIYWEGYGMYRKIYMDGYPAPTPFLHTAMGHSIAHWDGDALVIETTHLREHPYMDDLPATADATVSERYTLERREYEGEQRDFLVADVTLTDPKVYTEPVRMRAELRREPDMFILEYTCSTTLWEEYLLENELTPPDLSALP